MSQSLNPDFMIWFNIRLPITCLEMPIFGTSWINALNFFSLPNRVQDQLQDTSIIKILEQCISAAPTS